MDKPPIGLIPKKFSEHYGKRHEEIRMAIYRYLSHTEPMKIPIEWVEEYNEIVENSKK